MTRKTFLAALLCSAALFLPVPAAYAQGGPCLSERDINTAVASGQILSLNEVLNRAGVPPNAIRRPVKVCDQGGQLNYIIPVDQGANVDHLVLNARTGQR